MNVLGQFCVGRPDMLEERLDLFRILCSIIVGEKGAGVAVFLAQRLFEALLD
ncbi:hypothetical protein D3C83_318740 [compost metagenome]